MAQNTPVEMVRHASTLSILWGVLLIVFGMVGIGSPLLAAVAVNALVAWLIVLAGVVHLMLSFGVHGAGSMIWKVLVGIAYLCFGGYLLFHPVLGVATLTLLLASLFLIEGILNIILYVKIRPIHGSSWLLIDGIITLLLGLMIYMQWPSSSAWAIGTLVGISMIFSGVARVMMSLAVRKAADTVSSLAAYRAGRLDQGKSQGQDQSQRQRTGVSAPHGAGLCPADSRGRLSPHGGKRNGGTDSVKRRFEAACTRACRHNPHHPGECLRFRAGADGWRGIRDAVVGDSRGDYFGA